MTAAVSKIMRAQDLIVVAAKCRVTTAFRNTIGLPERLSTRLQPNHPTDGIVASLIDGLLFGIGDAVIGVNPATDGVQDYVRVVTLLDEVRQRLDIPTQTCCLGHVTTAVRAINMGAPVDLVFQSIAGSEKATGDSELTWRCCPRRRMRRFRWREARLAAMSLRLSRPTFCRCWTIFTRDCWRGPLLSLRLFSWSRAEWRSATKSANCWGSNGSWS
jgi:hypothetical protein